MTTQQSRPGGGYPEPARDASLVAKSLAASTRLLDAEHAHEFGRGMSQTERDALNRRALRGMGDQLELMLRQAARRFIAETLTAAFPSTWLRRAEQLEAVGTPAADEAAKAARRHAWLLAQGLPDDVASEVDEWLAAEVKPA